MTATQLPDALDAYGTVISVGEGVGTVEVARSDVSAVARRMLDDMEVLDISIAEPPIEDVIADVFANRIRTTRDPTSPGSTGPRRKIGFHGHCNTEWRRCSRSIGFIIEPSSTSWCGRPSPRLRAVRSPGTPPTTSWRTTSHGRWSAAMNISLTPYVWDGRIQRGRINDHLTMPLHLFHRDLASFAGWKPMWIAWWIPLAAMLVAVFQPRFGRHRGRWWRSWSPSWTAFVLRFIILWVLGLISFWTTRASALFEIVMTAEILLSGRLVPLELMPAMGARL